MKRHFEVRQHRGAPAIFADDEPLVGLMFMSAQDKDGWREDLRAFKDAGVRIIQTGHGNGPQPMLTEDGEELDFERIDRETHAMLEVYPQAYLLPRVQASRPGIEVAFVDATLIENNNVGNEWSVSAEMGADVLAQAQTLRARKRAIQIRARVEEADTHPDIGTGSIKISRSQLSREPTPFEVEVSVEENNGRYTGNKATWRLRFTARLVDDDT